MSWFVRRALVSSACLATLSLGACGDDVSVVAPPPEPAIKSVVVSPGGAAIRVGETLVMVAFVNADSGAVRTVRWSSADPRRASVTANGIVTGISEGIAVITATSTVRAEVQASATITVLPGPTVRQVAIVPATLSLRVGETSPLVPVVAADSGADRTVIWSSVDPSRVSVSSTGVITALAEGTAVITATSRARPDIAASAAVTVVPAAGVRSVAVTPQGLELLLGQQQALAVTVDADPGVARTVTYSTNDASIATVSGAGVVTGVGAGTATITVAATADPRVAATVVATVKPPTAPTVSIQSVTQGGTSLPVNLAGAAGQLDVSINVAAGTDPLQRLDLVISQNGRDSVVASQVYAASLAARTSLARTSLAPRLTSSGDSAHDLARHVAALQHAAALVTSSVVLSFRSNMYDAATGTVAFRNGPATIRAVARSVAGSAGAGPTATNSVAVTLDNRDGFHVSMRPLASTGIANATDANGLRWVQAGQGLEVTTIPVSFSARGVGSRILSYPGNAPVATLFSTKAGIAVDTILLPSYSAPTAGPSYAAGELPAIIASDLNANQLLLTGTPGTEGAGILNLAPRLVAGSAVLGLRIDNAPPPAGATFTLSTATGNSNNWVNGAYEFSSGLTGIAGDLGVGLPGANAGATAASVQATYRVTGGALTDTAVVRLGSDLSATDSHLAYSAEARYGDRLGNARSVALTASGPVHPLSTFGVDVLPPITRLLTTAPAGQVVASNQAVYTTLVSGGSTLAFGVEAIDDRAGFGATPVLASIRLLAQPNPIGGNTGTTTCVLGTLANGTCTATPTAFEVAALPDAYRRLSVPVDAGTGSEGYYTYSVSVRDQAGNESAPLTRAVLYDQGTGGSAPLVSTVTIPAPMRGNQPVTFLPSAVDNVELYRASLFVSYPNLPTATSIGYEAPSTTPPSNGAVAIGTLFDPFLTSPVTDGNVFTIAQFIRALEVVDGADAPQPYNAATVKPDGVNVIVHDAPDLAPATVASNVPIFGSFVESPSTPTPGFAALTGLQQLLKWRRTPAGANPLRFEAVGPSGQTRSPFARVILLQLITPANCAGCGLAPNASYWRVVNETTSVTGLDNGIERLWRYDFGSRTSGQSYIAVGVTGEGDAIASQVVVP